MDRLNTSANSKPTATTTAPVNKTTTIKKKPRAALSTLAPKPAHKKSTLQTAAAAAALAVKVTQKQSKQQQIGYLLQHGATKRAAISVVQAATVERNLLLLQHGAKAREKTNRLMKKVAALK